MAHKINRPAKVLRVDVSSVIPGISWPHDDGEGDPYWSGGITPKPYRWEITMTVNTYTHGSHLTRTPNIYNGLDINVGDWIAGATTGISLKIISVTMKTTTTVVCIVEDYLRYNTFRSAVGDGIFTIPGPGVIFEVNENGKPIVDPLPVAVTSSDFFANLDSRFKAFTLQENFLIDQISHGFLEGSSISIDPNTGNYTESTPALMEYVVGSVGLDGPGPNAFLLKPTTRLIENYSPALPGTVGSFIYADATTPGALTVTKSNRKLFLQLTDSVAGSVTGTVIGPTTTILNQMNINGGTVTFTSTTLAQAIIDINNASAITGGVFASEVLAPVTIQTSLSLAYGLVGTFPDIPGPAGATFNGSLVTFTDITDGFAAFGQNVGIESDMARDINAAGIPNIFANTNGSNLVVTNTVGGAITIANVSADKNFNVFAGANSSSGLPLSAPASTNNFLKLTTFDGSEIILQDVTGTPIADFGLVSADNGRLPVALVVEQGIRKGDTYVVTDIASRDALSVLVGDQAHVLNKGDLEWGLYMYDGTQWTLTSSEESSRTDSDTLSIIINWNDGGLKFIGQINAGTARVGSGTRVSPVSIEVITPFNGAPVIEVGDAGDFARLFTDNLVDLSAIGNYSHNPIYQYTGATDTDLYVNFNAGGATVGQARVTITYS